MTANVSDLLHHGYLNNVTGISTPHVFHIRPVRDQCTGEVAPGIYTKHLWSSSLTQDPWSRKPFVLLRKRIRYRDVPPAQMRGPTEECMDAIKRGLVTFARYEPDELVAQAELQEGVTEMEMANDPNNKPAMHWQLEGNFEPIYVAAATQPLRVFDISPACSPSAIPAGSNISFAAQAETAQLSDNFDSDASDITEDEEESKEESSYDTAVITRDRLLRRLCDPIVLGREVVGLSSVRRKESITMLNIGDFICTKVDTGNVLPFYVGKVREVFQYKVGCAPVKWQEDIENDPDVKFVEVHWWEMRKECVHKGYSQRLYEAVRTNKDRRCVDHLDVVCETSILYCFTDLIARSMRGSQVVSGKLGRKVLQNVMEIING